MAAVTCVDGSVLSVLPVPCLGRDGVPYEATLRLLRDGRAFGEVGQRCAFFLAASATRLREARAEHGDDALAASPLESGLRAWLAADGDAPADGDGGPQAGWPALERYLPPDRELFAFLARDPDDVATAGELRARVRDERTWTDAAAGRPGRWEHRRQVVLEAWGEDGTGVRAVLDSSALLRLLDALLAECAALGVGPDVEVDLRGVRRPVG